MQIFAQSILFILCLLMFKVKREYKFAILMLSAICFNCVTLPFIPFGGSKYILSECFILSELPYITSHFKSIKSTILKSLMLAILIASIVLIANSPHYNNLSQCIRFVLMEFVSKYFVICYAFLSVKDKKDLYPSLQLAYYGLLILTAFAIINYVNRHAIFIDEMLKGVSLTDVMQDAGSKFTYSDRFRVQAMFPNPFDYGYVCICLLLFNLYGYHISLINKKRLYIVLLCSIFGIITCGCRTNMICAIIGVFTYVLFAFDLNRKIKYLVLFSICSIIVVSLVPWAQERINEILSIFDNNSSVNGGSSIEMRKLQYAAVLYHIKDHTLFGRGLDYFNIDMGYGEGKQFLVDKDLFGLEGVIMNLLLERGIFGLCIYLFFYITLFLYFYKIRKLNKYISALSLSILFVYLAFANMTGELSSVFISLLILGSCLKLSLSEQPSNYMKS